MGKCVVFVVAAAAATLGACASGPTPESMLPSARLSAKQVARDQQQCLSRASSSQAVAAEKDQHATRLLAGGLLGGVGGLVGTAIGNSISEKNVTDEQAARCLARKGYRTPT